MTRPRMKLLAALPAALMAMTATFAHADTITADWTYYFSITNVNFTANLPGLVGGSGQGTTLFKGDRTDLPAGPGVDTIIPDLFDGYCVEIGEGLGQGSNTHASVTPLHGSTTDAGGISGPVFFDAVRTQNIQRLWSNFKGLAVDENSSAAFQLAQWEIAFDDDVSLSPVNRFWVDAGQFQAGITDVAETWLTAIRTNAVTSEAPIYLLSGAGVQDQLTVVPEPATMLALGLGAIAVMRRRRKA